MKIAIVGAVGIPAKYGGFETLIENITLHLGERYEIHVYCSARAYSRRRKRHNNAELHYVPFDANGIQSIIYDIVSILSALRYADRILILGVSGAVVLPFIRYRGKERMKTIVNVDGIEWRREKWSWLAKSFLKYSERLAIQNANIVVADNSVIQEYIASCYDRRSELIAYGSDHVERNALTEEVLIDYPYLAREYAFTVCRIEPENKLHIILEAIAEGDLPIVIIGNWKASNYGIELRQKFATVGHIYLLDPIFEQGLLDQIRSNCYLYIHGHSAGGTNPSLVEAMRLGLPVFAFDVDYNKSTTEECARYFMNTEQLVMLIKSTPNDVLKCVGEKMSEIASRRYRWRLVSSQYARLFDEA